MRIDSRTAFEMTCRGWLASYKRRTVIRWGIAFVLIGALLLPLAASAASWSKPVSLGKGNSAPVVALDAQGNSHIVWVSNRNQQLNYLRCANLAPKDCAAPETLPTQGLAVSSPALALNADGKPHVVWTAPSGDSTAIFLSVREESGWTTPQQVSTEPNSDKAAIAIGAGNEIRVVYQTVQGSGGQIIYVVSTDGIHFSFPRAVAAFPEGPAMAPATEATEGANDYSHPLAEGFNPRIALDSEGRAHVVWNTTSPTAVYYAYQTGPAAFSTPILVSSGRQDQKPDVVVSPYNDLVGIVWSTRKDDELAFAIFNRGVRTYLQDGLGGMKRQQAARLAADCGGTFHVVFQGHKSSGQWGIYHRSYNPHYNWLSGRTALVAKGGDAQMPAIAAHHQATVVYANTTDREIKGLMNALDITCLAPPPPPDTNVEHVPNDDPRLRFIRPFRALKHRKASEDNYARCDDGKRCQTYATVRFDFLGGKRLEWETAYARTYGFVEIWLDGVRFEKIDLCKLNPRSRKPKFAKRTYIFFGDANTPHSIEIVGLGDHSHCSPANKNYFAVDGFNVIR